ncbi:N-acetyltransferase [Nesterenkonia pannonica]|uniref:GNAT family N-acetyltransferase n=1 Tax=Nesterenkonia pannonica TaxID=1548602 RepID=UPI0021640A5B|nr:GNAT family N-acetyltransferase [Nesterenkonia pannonica]
MSSQPDDAHEVKDQPDQERYVLLMDGETAYFLEYQDLGDRLRAFVHTQVEDSYQGRGVGSRLVGGALERAAESGLAVIPRCPMVQSFIRKNPEHAELVPEERRKELSL